MTEFINRSGETVDVEIFTTSECEKPVFVSSGAWQSFASTPTNDLKQASIESATNKE